MEEIEQKTEAGFRHTEAVSDHRKLLPCGGIILRNGEENLRNGA